MSVFDASVIWMVSGVQSLPQDVASSKNLKNLKKFYVFLFLFFFDILWVGLL